MVEIQNRPPEQFGNDSSDRLGFSYLDIYRHDGWKLAPNHLTCLPYRCGTGIKVGDRYSGTTIKFYSDQEYVYLSSSEGWDRIDILKADEDMIQSGRKGTRGLENSIFARHSDKVYLLVEGGSVQGAISAVFAQNQLLFFIRTGDNPQIYLDHFEKHEEEPYFYDIGVYQHKGDKDEQQDSVLVSPVKEFTCNFPKKLIAIADGMGKPDGGRKASLLAVEVIEQAYNDPLARGMDASSRMQKAIQNGHEKVKKLRAFGNFPGTTALVAAIDRGELYFGNVGDGSVYLLNVAQNTGLLKLTKDQREIITEKHAFHRTEKRVQLTQFIGCDWGINPQYDRMPVRAGDCYLFCSDGITDAFDGNEDLLRQILGLDADYNAAVIADRVVRYARTLMDYADNMTAVVLKVNPKKSE